MVRENRSPIANKKPKGSFLNELNQSIMKRVILMSKKRVDYIYDDLEESRKKKERMVKNARGCQKGPIDIRQLYHYIVSGQKH